MKQSGITRNEFHKTWLNVTCALLIFAALVLNVDSVKSDTLSGKCDQILAKKMAVRAVKGWTSVIVKLNGELTQARKSQLTALGGDVVRHLPIIDSLAVRIPTRNLAKLAELPYIAHLSSDGMVGKNDEFIVEHSGADVANSQYGLTGNDVTVAVLDSGVRACADFNDLRQGTARLVTSPNFASDSGVNDTCGHGTHVAGIIAGNGASSTGKQFFRTFTGIAPRAHIVSIRVLDSNGQGTVSGVIAGMQWAIRNRNKYNIRVMNISLGHPVNESYTTDPLCQAAEAVLQSGIVVVCAAGNEGRQQDTVDANLDNEGYGTAYGTIQSPGNDPFVITVGATKSLDGIRDHDRIATYSSRGPSRLDFVLKPDIVAPGNRVISLNANASYLDNAYGGANQIPWTDYSTATVTGSSAKYFRLSGTSMSAPVVSGAVALMLEKEPRLSPYSVKARLMVSADKWLNDEGYNDPCTYGAGYLNIPAALDCQIVAMDYTVSPVLAQDENGNIIVDPFKAIWGKTIWGTGITDLKAIWGCKAIWGSGGNILEASKAIWGKSVWFDKAIWGCDSSAVDLTSKAVQGE